MLLLEGKTNVTMLQNYNVTVYVRASVSQIFEGNKNTLCLSFYYMYIATRKVDRAVNPQTVIDDLIIIQYTTYIELYKP